MLISSAPALCAATLAGGFWKGLAEFLAEFLKPIYPHDARREKTIRFSALNPRSRGFRPVSNVWLGWCRTSNLNLSITLTGTPSFSRLTCPKTATSVI